MANFRLEIFVPHLPPTVNVFMRMNFMERKRRFDDIYSLVYFASYKKKPKQPLKKCTITLIRFGTKYLDYDGLVGSFKPVVDGLIKSEVLFDDSYPITGPWNVDQRIVSKKEVGISIIVEEKHEG
jgi:hypothetical protein